MSATWPPEEVVIEAREQLIIAAIHVLSAERIAPDVPSGAWEMEYAEEKLATAARALAQAVDGLPADKRPVGWNT